MTTIPLKVLDAALHIKEFTAEQMQTRTKVSATKGTLRSLVKKQLILEDASDRYRVPTHLDLLINPKKYETFAKIDYSSVAYDKKLDPKFPLEEIKNRLNRFLDVKDIKECHAMHYKVMHEK